MYLNPRNVYIGRVFNYCTHDYIIKLFNHYNNGRRIFHNGDTSKLYNILPYRTIEILPKIVDLFLFYFSGRKPLARLVDEFLLLIVQSRKFVLCEDKL